MSSSGKVVVFDIGNVLIEWDRRRLFSQLIDDETELQHFLDEVFTLEANALLDRGTALDQVAAQVASDHPEHRETILAFADRWEETLGPVIDGSVEILEELSKDGIRLYALSNWGADTFETVRPNYPFLTLFDGMVISGQERVVKPEPAIFRILCERYAFEPEQAIFIDDSAANVAAAMSLGFDAILFDSPERLRQLLIERNLL